MQSVASELPEETAASLVELAAVHGFDDVTEEQIAKWSSCGLLPSFRREFPGQGNGSKTFYPAGTGQQLLVFCHVHFQEKVHRLSDVGWRMWWYYGCAVDKQYWVDALSKAAAIWDDRIRLVREYDHDSGDFLLKENIEDRLHEFSNSRTPNKLLRRIRRYLGCEGFPNFARIIMRVMIGGFSGWSGHVSDGEKEQGYLHESDLLDKGLGLNCARENEGDNLRPWLKGDTAPVLKKVSKCFQQPQNQILGEVTDSDVHKARDELLLLLRATENCKTIFEQQGRKRAFGFDLIGRVNRGSTPLVQALMLQGWLRIRHEPEFAEGLKEKQSHFITMAAATPSARPILP